VISRRVLLATMASAAARGAEAELPVPPGQYPCLSFGA
jgi:hypothetical protein